MMINKVDGNNYNIYTKQKKLEVPDTGEKFSLSDQKKESAPEAKDKKEIPDQERQQEVERSGVRLQLSTSGREAGRQSQAKAPKTQSESVTGQTSLLETVRDYIVTVIAAVREFFYTIWNNPQQEEILQDPQLQEDALQENGQAEDDPQKEMTAEDILQEDIPGISQEAVEMIEAVNEMSALALEDERRNREIQQSLRDGNMEKVISLLTDNGRKTIAKNSTLLTSYDKNGRLVEINASDRERALHGDRNTRKL